MEQRLIARKQRLSLKVKEGGKMWF